MLEQQEASHVYTAKALDLNQGPRYVPILSVDTLCDGDGSNSGELAFASFFGPHEVSVSPCP